VTRAAYQGVQVILAWRVPGLLEVWNADDTEEKGMHVYRCTMNEQSDGSGPHRQAARRPRGDRRARGLMLGHTGVHRQIHEVDVVRRRRRPGPYARPLISST